jgi:malonyl-CoA O-methyltransferase
MSLSLDAALPEKRAARRGFDRATAFDAACFIHDEARARLFERLDLIRLEPAAVVDLGCATGRGAQALAARYPAAQVLAIDSSLAMLRSASAALGSDPVALLAGDAEALPLRPGCADLVLANLVLPWCRPDRVFAEVARVLADGGALLFATLGPDTLQEVRVAFAAVDDRIHVHAAFDMHDLGDLMMAAGLAEPVLDVDRIEVTYGDVHALVRDLRAVGGANLAGARRRTLTGRRRWRRFVERLPLRTDGKFAVTVELVFGHAWGRGPQQQVAATGEIRVPVAGIKRRSEST